MIDIKVAIAGPSDAGKTSLFNLVVENEQISTHRRTVGPNVTSQKIEVRNKVVKMKIIDTAGQSRFHKVTQTFFRGIEGAIIVFDLTSKGSFEEVESWISDVRRVGGREVSIIIVGNKKDKERVVLLKEAAKFCEERGLIYIETDDKDKKQMNQIVKSLLCEIFQFKSSVLKRNVEKQRQKSFFRSFSEIV
jgi:small GTP-binding protein